MADGLSFVTTFLSNECEGGKVEVGRGHGGWVRGSGWVADGPPEECNILEAEGGALRVPASGAILPWAEEEEEGKP